MPTDTKTRKQLILADLDILTAFIIGESDPREILSTDPAILLTPRLLAGLTFLREYIDTDEHRSAVATLGVIETLLPDYLRDLADDDYHEYTHLLWYIREARIYAGKDLLPADGDPFPGLDTRLEGPLYQTTAGN